MGRLLNSYYLAELAEVQQAGKFLTGKEKRCKKLTIIQVPDDSPEGAPRVGESVIVLTSSGVDIPLGDKTYIAIKLPEIIYIE
jgi:hypothetical protein